MAMPALSFQRFCFFDKGTHRDSFSVRRYFLMAACLQAVPRHFSARFTPRHPAVRGGFPALAASRSKGEPGFFSFLFHSGTLFTVHDQDSRSLPAVLFLSAFSYC